MKILLQIGVVFGIYWISQGIESILPIAFPASVISLVLLLVLLLVRGVKMEQVQEKADFLLGNLKFFFVPAAVSIMNCIHLVLDNALVLLVICTVSTVLGFAATVWTVRLTRRLMSGRKGGAK